MTTWWLCIFFFPGVVSQTPPQAGKIPKIFQPLLQYYLVNSLSVLFAVSHLADDACINSVSSLLSKMPERMTAKANKGQHWVQNALTSPRRHFFWTKSLILLMSMISFGERPWKWPLLSTRWWPGRKNDQIWDCILMVSVVALTIHDLFHHIKKTWQVSYPILK